MTIKFIDRKARNIVCINMYKLFKSILLSINHQFICIYAMRSTAWGLVYKINLSIKIMVLTSCNKIIKKINVITNSIIFLLNNLYTSNFSIPPSFMIYVLCLIQLFQISSFKYKSRKSHSNY